MKNLHFRAPGAGGRLADLVSRGWRYALREQILEAIATGDVRVAGAAVRDPAKRVAGGAMIDVAAREGRAEPVAQGVEILQQGDDFCVANKPVGWPSHAATPGGRDARVLVAAQLGRPVEEVWPVHRLDADVGGAWLIALSEGAAARLSDAFASSQVHKEYRALAPLLPWPEGVLRAGVDGKDAETRFRIVAERGEVCEVSLTPVTGRTHQLRLHLAGAHCSILGDPLYGGIALSGGLRLYSRHLAISGEGIDAHAPEPADFLPTERVFPPAKKPVLLQVSHATVAALKRGHPWILTDSETSDVGAYAPGTLARVRSVRGEDAGLCRIEGPGRIAARVWHPAPASPARSERGVPASGGERDDVRARVQSALAKRSKLLRGMASTRATTVFRLVHAEADGFPGLAVDLLEDELRVLSLGRACDPLLAELVETLVEELPIDPAVVWVRHLAERPKGELHSVRTLRGVPRTAPFTVRERGLLFEVDNGLALPLRSRPGFGLFVDQRLNRERIADVIRARGGGRWLNLFCHTGSFSVAALAAGADRVTSVDLSRPYLNTLQRNLEHNRLDLQRHECVKLDAERYLDQLPRDVRFDGIVLDPPTAAAAGRRFWSVRSRQGKLIELCLQRLSAGGTLLTCRNDHGAKDPLREVVQRAAGDAKLRLRGLKDAPPGADFPRLAGFREGDAFEGVFATRA